MEKFISEAAGTVGWHSEIIKQFSKRSKLIECMLIVTIKIDSIESAVKLNDFFRVHGILGISYKIESLGFFECRFKKHQIKLKS